MLLQAGYVFYDEMDELDAEEYNKEFDFLKEWFRRKGIKHAVVNFSEQSHSCWMDYRFIAASEEEWGNVLKRFPYHKPAPSRLEELMNEPETDDFTWSVKFVGCNSLSELMEERDQPATC